MKLNLILFLFVVLLASGCINQNDRSSTKLDRTKVINELIGDESYLSSYGKLPDSLTSETLRIKTHLSYVEELLRARSTGHLTANEKASRASILSHLHDYIQEESFPKNYDIAGERRPCFLDRDGNICAVGYLVEQTKSLALACEINSKYQYDWVSDMDMPELNDWIAQSGLTKEEFALIQPTYESNGPKITSDDVSLPVISQLMAFNIITTCINGKQIADGGTSNLAPILGISTGAVNIGYSALTVKNGGSPVAFFGLLTGTSSIVTSSVNLIFKKKLEKSNISLSSNIFNTPTNRYIPGISVTVGL